jgi:hypothetical protein
MSWQFSCHQASTQGEHPCLRWIIEGVIASQATGIIQQFIVVFDIFRPPFEMV